MNSPPRKLREELPSSSAVTLPLLEAYTAVKVGKDEDIEKAASLTSSRSRQLHKNDINDGNEKNKQQLQTAEQTEFIKEKSSYAKFMLFFIGLQVPSLFILSDFLVALCAHYSAFVLISDQIQGYRNAKIPNDEIVTILNNTLIVNPILSILNHTTLYEQPSIFVTGQQINDANESIVTGSSHEIINMLETLLPIILSLLTVIILNIQVLYLRDHLIQMKHNIIKYFGTDATNSSISDIVEDYYEEVRSSGMVYWCFGCISGFWLAVGTLSYVLPLFCQKTVSSVWNQNGKIILYHSLFEAVIFCLLCIQCIYLKDDDDDDQEGLEDDDVESFQLPVD